MGYSSLLLVGIFVVSAVAVPLEYNSEQCARHCTESHDFRYKPGTTYSYNYETTTVTTVQGTTAEKSQLHLTAEADIEVLSKCEFSMRLRNVALKQSDPQNTNYVNLLKGSREFSGAVEKNVLKFSFQNGQVDSLCPTDGEPVWVLNIKRGVLSAFQTSVANLDRPTSVIETDVSGKCLAEYQSMGRGWKGTLTIRKTKDLTTCTERQNSQTSLQSTPYSDDMPVRSLPLIKGNQECEQIIGHDILQSSSCTETHMFRPFSNHNNGAITTVTQKLTFVTMGSKSFTGNDYRPTREDMLFDHEYEDRSTGRKTSEVDRALSDLCKVAKDEIQASVPGKFANFVYKLRQLDHSSLLDIYRRVDRICPDNPTGRKFFMDAIPVVGTTDSVRLMSDFISQGVVATEDIDLWFTSLAFISKPTREMITTLTNLLDGRNEQAILGVSALIHTFCVNNGDCGSSGEVKQAVRKLVGNLGETCYGPEERKVLLTLKAIGNIGQIAGHETILERCFRNPQNSIEVRLAAIQTFRRLSCDIPRDNLQKMFSDFRENTELRIAAYLGLMNCPSPQIVQVVKETLEKEKVNQVGSFVWTHLNNIRKSSNPAKYQIQDIVSDLYIMNKFHTDVRKFSKAMEGSIFFDSINTGIHVDSHLIYSPEYFMIRSAMLNFTFDLFGHTCNLFEVGGRVEGLDRLMESFFGPKGYFPQESVHKVFKNMREKRSISDNKIDKMDKQFDAKSRFNKDPSGSLYLKVMGNDVMYMPFGSSSGTSGGGFSLNDLITELAKQQEVEFTKSFMFLDTTHTIPMATGMPLRLAINGTATVGLKMGGKFEVRSFKEVDIRGRFQPSGAVEIASLLTVDAGEARTGMRIVATMHSSSLVDGKVEVRNGQVVRAEVNMPRERVEMIDIQSKIFLVHGSEEKEQEGVTTDQTKVKKCTGQYIRRVLGVEMCAELQSPGGSRSTPLFPLSGPAAFKVYVQKTDPSLKSYNFEARCDKEMTNGGLIRKAFISLNTPRSTIDRDISAEFNLNYPDRSLTLRLRTPFKRIGMNAKYINDESQKRFDLGVTVDDQETFAIRSEMQVQNTEGGSSYTPSLEILGPKGRLLAAKASTYLRYGQKYSGELSIEDLTVTPITLRGDVDFKGNDRYEMQFGLGSDALVGNVQGYTQFGEISSSKLTVDYQLLQGRRETLDISGKFRDLSANALTKFIGTLNIQATALPLYSTSMTWEMQSTTGQLENTLQLNIGESRRGRVHTINIQEIIRYEGTLAKNKAAVTLKFGYPQRNMDYVLDMKHENTDSSLKNRMKIQYAPGRQINTLVDLMTSTSSRMRLKGDLRLEYPGRDMRLLADINEQRSREFLTTLTAQWKRGRQVNVVANYRNKNDRNQFRHEGDAEVTIYQMRPITMAATVGMSVGQYSASGEVDLGQGKYRISTEYSNPSTGTHSINCQMDLLDSVYSTEASLATSEDRTTGNMDVRLPTGRRIASKIAIANSERLNEGLFEVAWDADRDPSRKVVVDMQLRCPRTGHEGKISVTLPDRIVRGSFVTSLPNSMANNRLELEWDVNKKVTVSVTTNNFYDYARRQIAGDILITSPFNGYENFGLRLRHVIQGRKEWNSELNIHWHPSRKIVILSEGSYYANNQGRSFLGNVKFTTPFKDFESFILDVTHVTGPSELSSKGEVQWGDNKKIGVGLYGSLTGSGFRGGMNFTSPLISLQQITATVSHVQSPGSYRTQGELQWGLTKRMTIDIDGQGSSSGSRRTRSFNLYCTTPFRGFETTSFKMLYNIDGTGADISSEANWNTNKMRLGLAVSQKFTRSGRSIESKVSFTSPFRSYDNFQLTSTIQTDMSKFELNSEAQLPRNKMMNFKCQARVPSGSDFDASAEFSSSFRNMERMSLNIVHKYDSNLRTTAEAKYGEKKMTAVLTGIYAEGFKTHSIEGAIVVKTPFRNYEELKMSLSHNRRDTQFITKLQGNWNQDSLTTIHDLKLRDLLNFETSLQVYTPFRAMPSLRITVDQGHTTGQFRHNSVIEMNGKTTLFIECFDRSTNYGTNMAATMKLNTPSYKLRSLTIDTSYESTRREYKPRLSIEWNVDKRLSIEGNLVNYRFQRVDGKLSYTSPFYSYETLTLAGKYDLTAPKKTADLSFQWGPRSNKMVSIMVSAYRNPENGELDISAVTPFLGYEKMSLISNYGYQDNELSASISSQWGWKKMGVSGKLEPSRNGAEVKLTVTTPIENYEQITAGAKYSMETYDVTGEMNMQWAPDKKVIVAGEFLNTKDKTLVKLATKTPFPGYEIMIMELNQENLHLRKTFNGFFQWNVLKKVELTAELATPSDNRGNVNIVFRSPFRGFEEISADGKIERDSTSLQTELNVQWHPRKKVNINGNVQYENGYPSDVSVNMDTPFSPIRNAKYTYRIDNSEDNFEIKSLLEWDKSKKIDMLVTLKQPRQNYMEGKIIVNTPFRNYRTMSIEGSLLNEQNLFDGQLNLVSPFEGYETIALKTNMRTTPEKYVVVISMDSPSKKLNIVSSLRNAGFQPFDFKLNIDAPFTTFKVLNLDVLINEEAYKSKNSKIIVTTGGGSQSISLKYDFGSEEPRLEIKCVDVPFLPVRTLTLRYDANYADQRNIRGMISVEYPNNLHRITATMRSRKDKEISVKLESPFLKEEVLTTKMVYASKRRSLEGSILISSKTHSHEATMKYETDNRQISASLNIESTWLPSKTLTVDGKYINSNNRDMEVTLSITTPNVIHSLVGTLKNYGNEREAQLKIDSPSLRFRTLSITGTFKNDNFEVMEGTLTASVPQKEIRIAGNMKRNKWKNFEAFVTLNTPYDPLGMVRIDTKFSNDHMWNMDGSLQVETSHNSFRTMGITGKLQRSRGTEDVSITLKLPVEKYQTVGILANVHYTPDLTVLTPRVTVSLPSGRYSAYGSYEATRESEMSATVGYEWGRSAKIEVNTNAKFAGDNIQLQVTVTTPFRRHENYESRFTYTKNDRTYSAGVTYRNSEKQTVSVRGLLTYVSPDVFDAELGMTSPYRGYEEWSSRIRRQRYNTKSITNAEMVWSPYEKISTTLEMNSNRSHSINFFQLETPFEAVQNLRLSSTVHQYRSNIEANGDVIHNGIDVFRGQISNIFDSASRQYERSLTISLPSLPVTVSTSLKPLPSGKEVTIKTTCPTKTVTFHSTYQSTDAIFFHTAQLAWQDKTFLYELKASDTSRGRNLASEFTGKLSFPRRAFEVKGIRTSSSKQSTCELDFYWDAARDRQKHMVVGFEYQDINTRGQTAHKLKLMGSHPKLTKDIVATSQVTSSSTETHCKLEVEYSRHQQHNIMAELRLKDISRSRRETHYTLFLTTRHPASNLDMGLSGEFIDTEQETSTNARFNHLDSRNQQRFMELKSKILKLRNEIDLLMRSDENQFSAKGHMFHMDREFTLAVEGKINDQPPMHSHLRLSERHKKLEVNLTGPDYSSLYMTAYTQDYSTRGKVTHSTYGRTYSDATLYLGLDPGRILRMVLTWRPNLWEEATNTLSKKYTKISRDLSSSTNRLLEDLSTETNNKLSQMSRAMAQHLRPFQEEISQDLIRVKDDINRGKAEFNRMYRNNEFYMKDIVKGMIITFDFLCDATTLLLNVVADVLFDLCFILADVAQFLCDVIVNVAHSVMNCISCCLHMLFRVLLGAQLFLMQLLQHTLDMLARTISLVAEVVWRLTTIAGEKIYEIMKRYAPFVENSFISLRDGMYSMVDATSRAICNNPFTVALSNYWSRVVATFSAFRDQNIIATVQKNIVDTYNNMADFIQNAATSASEYYNTIRNHPHVDYIAELSNRAMEKGIKAYSVLGLDSVVANVVGNAVQQTKNLVRHTAIGTMYNLYNMKHAPHFSYNPGSLTVEYSYTMPELLLAEFGIALRSDSEAPPPLAISNFNIWDSYYQYKRLLNPTYWIPPFETHAIIAGNQHYMTFDKFHFDFAGECSYLLARDFVDGNFTVSVNYVNDGQRVVKKSLTVLTEGKKVDVSHDYKVTIDDTKVELPQQIGGTTIKREDSIVHLRSDLGFEVLFNFVHDICTVKMSGFYFGKTAGLFGTYDYEPRLDIMTPDRRIAGSIDAFANNWEVGSAVCRKGKNLAAVVANDFRVNERCDLQFLSANSEFKNCFKQVNPEPYKRMCASDLSLVHENKFDLSICTSAAAYVQECKEFGVPLRMPKQCVRCEKHDGTTMEEGDIIKLTKEDPVRSVDMVFVVEEKECNREVMKYLGKFAQGMEDTLRVRNYRNIRYAVVGFGGNAVHSEPHIHTIDGLEFGSVRSVDSAFSSLTVGSGSTNVFKALRYAASLSFRAGVTKIFVVAKCSACQTEDYKSEYGDMLRTLLDGDISLHLIMNHEYQMKTKREKARRVIGVDNKYAYTLKDGSKSTLKGDKDLLAQVRVPKDVCVPLALEVNGSSFASQQLTETRKNAYKKFIDVMARRISMTAEPSDCQVCECIAINDGVGKSICQRCLSPDIANILSPDLFPMYKNDHSSDSSEDSAENA